MCIRDSVVIITQFVKHHDVQKYRNFLIMWAIAKFHSSSYFTSVAERVEEITWVLPSDTVHLWRMISSSWQASTLTSARDGIRHEPNDSSNGKLTLTWWVGLPAAKWRTRHRCSTERNWSSGSNSAKTNLHHFHSGKQSYKSPILPILPKFYFRHSWWIT